MYKRIIIAGLCTVLVLVSVIVLTMHHGSPSKSSQHGSTGPWTAQQKADAQKVLTSAPVSESPALAACVVSKVSVQNTYSQFQEYAAMAAVNDFNNPNLNQSSVIASLMLDALSCPEAN